VEQRTCYSLGQRERLEYWLQLGGSPVARLATCTPSALYLRYPLQLRWLLRSTNLLECSLDEVQRRVRIIGRAFSVKAVTSACAGPYWTWSSLAAQPPLITLRPQGVSARQDRAPERPRIPGSDGDKMA
jgi:hypothetical protein